MGFENSGGGRKMKTHNLRNMLHSINLRKLAKPAVVKNMKLKKRYACFCVFGLNRWMFSYVYQIT
jgi:hypothetical protein